MIRGKVNSDIRRAEPMHKRRGLIPLASLLLLSACGGGGGGGSTPATQNTAAPTTPPLIQAQPTESELNAASRFASRASLGMNYDQIRALSIKGHDSWLEEQFALPVEYHDEMVAD